MPNGPVMGQSAAPGVYAGQAQFASAQPPMTGTQPAMAGQPMAPQAPAGNAPGTYASGMGGQQFAAPAMQAQGQPYFAAQPNAGNPSGTMPSSFNPAGAANPRPNLGPGMPNGAMPGAGMPNPAMATAMPGAMTPGNAMPNAAVAITYSRSPGQEPPFAPTTRVRLATMMFGPAAS